VLVVLLVVLRCARPLTYRFLLPCRKNSQSGERDCRCSSMIQRRSVCEHLSGIEWHLPFGVAIGAAGTGDVAAVDEIIFNFFLSDIVRLPFDSNSTKIGVSRYIDTNGLCLCACDDLLRPKREHCLYLIEDLFHEQDYSAVDSQKIDDAARNFRSR